jgi:hypothetical protein
MQRYQEYYQKMIDENGEIFKKFFDVHDRYVMNPQITQDEFNSVGREIVEIIHDYERRLCGNSEKGQYARFSAKLAEKFWGEARKDFPKIDFVGVKIT